jgi:hypothetical protein
MGKKAGPGASLTAGVILLSVSCLNIGYGLCMTMHGITNAYLPVGIGVMFSALATTFIAKSAKMLSDQAAVGSDDT